MTAPENYVSRWIRLKGEAASARKDEPVVEASQSAPAARSEARSGCSQQGDDTASDDDFDPASLPPIETITADTDIREFLHSRVPAELTRLALRRAWASDPAIRDFIGIAENQWDFNDPNAIPGFGPLQASGHPPGLLEQALGIGNKLAETLAASREPAPPPALDCGPANPVLGRALDRQPATGSDRDSLAVGLDGDGITVSSDRGVEANDGTPVRRSHGKALPRFKI